MDIGSLFINLGIHGSDKTLGALNETKKAMGGLASISLEAKAAIIGAAYALEQLFSKSNHQGTDLKNFSALLGEGTQTLQKYQYALTQVGISSEETESTFKSLSDTFSKAALGGQKPAGLAQIANLTGGQITQKDIERYAQHPEEFIKRATDYANKEKRLPFRNQALKSIGFSDNFISGLVRGGASQSNLDKAPKYSEKEVASLDKANIAWMNLGNHIAMAIGHLNAAHGGELVAGLTNIVDLVLKLSDVLLHLGERLGIFKAISVAFKGISSIAGPIVKEISSLANALAKVAAHSKVFDAIKSSISNFASTVKSHFAVLGELSKDFAKFASQSKIFDKFANSIGNIASLLGSIVDLIVKASDAILVLGKTLHVFDALGGVVSAVADTFESITGALAGAAKDLDTGGTKGKGKSGGIAGLIQSPSALLSNASNASPQINSPVTTSNQHTTVNQNLHFSAGTHNANEVADQVKKAAKSAVQESHKHAFRQLSSQLQGS